MSWWLVVPAVPRRGGIVALGAALALLGGRAQAQAVGDMRVSDDNGQFDFWLPAPRRPDTELTNSAQLSLLLDDGPLWQAWVHLPSCAATTSPQQRCATTELEIGQQMYTPAGATTQVNPRPGTRPYAGWLYLSAAAQASTTSQADAVTLQLGVTGPPSLADQVQTAWHTLIGYPRARGWSHQIPFEPGVLLAADRQREIVQASIGGVPVISLVPAVGASVGNVLTGAHVGAEARIGYGVTTPWSAAVPRRGRKVELYGVAAVREDLIAYQLFLDGAMAQPATPVKREPLVLQYEFGAGLRCGPMELEYRGITRMREYTTGPPAHPYGVLTVGIRPAWL